MKPSYHNLLGLLFSASIVTACLRGFAQGTIVERGPHHQVLQRIVEETRPDGKVVPRVSTIVELETGMNYLDGGEWKPTVAEIEIINGVATARRGPHQVIFEANLKTAGAIDLLTPDGKRFRSTINGLAYMDAASGKSVMFAEVKDCNGAVLPPNQVWYQDAFEGDCVADVRMTYTKAGFEQDVILRDAPPSPSAYGLDPETTRLEVWTEFIEAPAAEMLAVVVRQETDPVRRQQMVEPDIIDQELSFGLATIPAGQAFPLTDGDEFERASAPTFKRWERIEGRLFLIERIEYSAVSSHLQRLPKHAALNRPRNVIEAAKDRKLLARMLPPAPSGARRRWADNQYAKIDAKRPGLVIDYLLLPPLNGNLTNYTFKADTTYHIKGNTSLYGTTVIEGGAVLKFTNSVSPQLNLYGPLECKTSPYRPAVFTAGADHTIGDIITNYTSAPSGTYAQYALGLRDSTTTYNVHDVRIRYAYYAFPILAGVKANIWHAQVGNSYCGTVWQANVCSNFRNLLLWDVDTALLSGVGGKATNHLQHATLHRVVNFRNETTNVVTLTNCLLISVTNTVSYTGANVETNLNDSGVFQTVGAGAHYLSTNSTYRNAGTTDIDSSFLPDLRLRTTYPPIVVPSMLHTNDLTFGAQAQRDTDTPDLGYHYSPLDYALGSVSVSNAVVTLSEGTAIGTYAYTASAYYGLALQPGASLYSTGSPTNLNRIVRYNTIQEQANSNWTNVAAASIWTTLFTSGASQAHGRFTEFAVQAQDAAHFSCDNFDSGSHEFRDCQFHGGSIKTVRPGISATNCLFNRTYVTLYDDFGAFNLNASFRDNTFFGGTLDLDHQGADSWTFRDNLFDNIWITNRAGVYTNAFNGYTTNLNRLPPTYFGDLPYASSNVSYQTVSSAWNYWYLPANSVFINKGSTNANLLTLYHFTTATNQVKETNTIVDIGFHYVALTNGVPIDTDGDGSADYLEDANGNGVLNSGETNPNDPNDWGLKVLITRPRKGSNLP